MNIFPAHAADFYKTGHIRQYPTGTESVYSNFTCRSSHWAKGLVLPDYDDKVVFFGLQGTLQWLLIEEWRDKFFNEPKSVVVGKYKRRMDSALGEGVVSTKHIEELHDLGYLPLEIKALPEGSRVDIRVPMWTIKETLPQFYWLTNYMETQLSAEQWQPITGATIAYEYRRLLTKYAELTGSDKDFVKWQGHDFSLRGMPGIHAGTQNGAAHLLSFYGTDTIPAIDYLEDYYGNYGTWSFVTGGLIGGSVPATEHSVMCMGGNEDEVGTFRRLVTEVYPRGVVSIVSDTWDFWQVVTEFTKTLKSEILGREGKVVFRPDSGDPVKIIVGEAEVIELGSDQLVGTLSDAEGWMVDHLTSHVADNTAHGEHGDSNATGYFRFEGKVYKIVVKFEWNRYDKQYYYIDYFRVASCEETVLTPAQKGAVECLWEVFGGKVTDKGYKLLDPHVGLIYGDSITIERAQEILKGLEDKGFASGNIVFGIGSFTYQHVTRDTFGSAIKATWGKVNGEPRELFKEPKTDNGVKKSARGLLRVEFEDGKFVLYDQQTPEQEKQGLLETVFRDGSLTKYQTYGEVRNRLWPKEK